jgi:hypothetical protein
MKPFNLQAAINGAPIQTSCGKYLKFVAHVSVAQRGQQVVVVDTLGNVTSHSDTTDAIVMAPVVRTHWANVHRSESGSVMVGVAMLDEKAVQLARTFLPGYIKTISFEVEE